MNFIILAYNGPTLLVMLELFCRYAFNCLKRFLPEDTVEKVNAMSITADGLGAVFDVPSDLLKTFLVGIYS